MFRAGHYGRVLGLATRTNRINSRGVFFYNRHDEVSKLTTRLEGAPRMSLILGPFNCGKSALVRHVLEQKRDDEGNPLFDALSFNLRGVNLADEDEVMRKFAKKIFFGSWKDGVWAQLMGDDFFHFGKTNDLTVILNKMADRVPAWKGPNPPPLLIIDNFGDLQILASQNTVLLKGLMDFCVRVTQKEGKMHVVFMSSDSFVDEWLIKEQGLPLTKSDVLVCGDLSKTDAYKYYLELLDSIVKANARHLFGRSEEDFEKIFHITGGRIYYIRRFVDQICSGRSIETASGFESVASRQRVLSGDLRGDAKSYSKEEARKLFEMLTSSASGYLPLSEVSKHFSKGQLKEMSKRSVIHVRPPSDFAHDLDPAPLESVVGAVGKPALRAMEELLKEKVVKRECTV